MLVTGPMWTDVHVAPGLVTRCPLELKLKKLRPEEEWRGSISYRGKEEAIPDASKVEDAIRQGQCLARPPLAGCLLQP